MIPNIFHAVARRQITDPETQRRCNNAFSSWSWIYDVGGVIPVHVWKFKRDATEIGDARDLPYLKDLIREAMSKSSSVYDVVFVTNDDVVMHPMLLGELKRHMSLYHAGTIRRVEIDTRAKDNRMPCLYEPPTAFMERGYPHLGRDGFAAQTGWLKEYLDIIPDYLLGAPWWDIGVAAFVRLMMGHKTVKTEDFYETIQGCELPDGLLIHECHDAVWLDKPGGVEHAGNNHNRLMFDEWRSKYCQSLVLKEFDEQQWSMSALIRHPWYFKSCGKTIEDVGAML